MKTHISYDNDFIHFFFGVICGCFACYDNPPHGHTRKHLYKSNYVEGVGGDLCCFCVLIQTFLFC